MMAFTTVIGIYINEMSLCNRSSILAESIHGAINGQAYGIWRLLFPTMHPVLGGVAGAVALIVWLVLGLWEAHKPWPVETNPVSSIGVQTADAIQRSTNELDRGNLPSEASSASK